MSMITKEEVAALVVMTEPYEFKDASPEALIHLVSAAVELGFSKGVEKHKSEIISKNKSEIDRINLYIKELEQKVSFNQREWVGLTMEDKKEYLTQDFGGSRSDAMDWAEKRLKEKNT